MPSQNDNPDLTLEAFFRVLREEQIRELSTVSPEADHPVSFARVIRIARDEVEPTWSETQHLAECRECQRLTSRARANLTSSVEKTNKRTWASWGIPILVTPPALMAGSKEPSIRELEPGVYRYTISDQESRRAVIELRAAGEKVRLRQAEGDPVLVEQTGKPLTKEFKVFPANPQQTGRAFLEGILRFARKQGREP